MAIVSPFKNLKIKFLNTILLLCLSKTLFGQVLEKIQPFSAATVYLEPDGRRVSLKLPNQNFITLAKIRGGISGDAAYVLERYDITLKSIFKSEILSPENEEFKEMYVHKKDLILISVLHNTESSTSTLKATFFDLTTGNKLSEKTLVEFKVNKWFADKSKGAIKQTFDNFVGATIGQQFTTPVDYQYAFRFSPDSSKILTYIFDYSQNKMIANAKIFNADLDKISEGEIHIDNNFVNYGLYINNGGEVVILNSDRLGRIVVVEYNLQNHANRFLDIQYTSARREGLKLHIVNDDVVYVSNLVTNSTGKLLAVMYSKFNFKAHLVEKINFHEISDGLKETATESREAAKMHGEEYWMNFEITDFMIDDSEKIILIAEKRELQSAEFVYDHASVNDKDKWKETTAKVGVEGILLFGFTKSDELLFENYCAKSQTADLISGLNCASYSMNVNKGKLRFLYTTSDSPSGLFNTFHYLEWDENKGDKIKDLKLPNPEGLGLLRNYTVWWDDRVIVTGRKGLMGKKSFISTYKLE